jgi:hypothetical protein
MRAQTILPIHTIASNKIQCISEWATGFCRLLYKHSYGHNGENYKKMTIEKIKFTVEKALKDQRKSTGIALLFPKHRR